jgi:hypothetical protein
LNQPGYCWLAAAVKLLYPAAAAEKSRDLSAAARSKGDWLEGDDMKVWCSGEKGSRALPVGK